MMPSSDHILSRVIAVLSEQVLPEMPASTWSAANVRACIGLLTCAQDSATLAQHLAATDAMLVHFLQQVADSDERWLDASLRSRMRAVLTNSSKQPLAGDHPQEVREVLSYIVTLSTGRRSPWFEQHLRECLAALNEAEFRRVARASKLMPF